MEQSPEAPEAILPLSVPEDDLAAFEHIRDLGDVAFASLNAALHDAHPTSQLTNLVKQVNCKLPATAQTHTHAILRALAGLIAFADQSRQHLHSLVPRLAANDELNAGSNDSQTLAQRLVSLTDSTALRLLGKSADLRREHQRTLADARIISDIRPIFADSLADDSRPEAMFVSHTLKLEYQDAALDGGYKSVYISLDESDMLSLRDAIMRALKKSKELRSTITEAGLVDMSQDVPS
ncbi:hypothetical protein [Candidatus Poriferisodalis sp.]|uniref:hypothetical protein n=1 Tax=Candidatus Poriferisodalis sp. TaxID=3101277 RepID=UPI003B0209A1